MNQEYSYSRYSKIFLRISIAALFLFFGALAVLRPETQIVWIRKEFLNLISDFLGIKVFMFILGVLQIVPAMGVLFNFYLKWSLWLIALILIPIIINLINFSVLLANDIALRDIVILATVIYLATEER
ncbi:MAG: hypothetical protein HYV52_00170 [Parcubacteria group bacterium]|nr:hypothetical protein [Parcubacteria group bacterium]